jgi:hypothetical protein
MAMILNHFRSHSARADRSTPGRDAGIAKPGQIGRYSIYSPEDAQ